MRQLRAAELDCILRCGRYAQAAKGGIAIERRWVVKKDGKPMASGPMDTIAPDDMVRQMYNAGYKTYIDGKLYRPKKEADKCEK
jgi:hypothetical protein